MVQVAQYNSDFRAHAQGPDRSTLTMAAVLLSEDGIKDEQIANHLGVTRRTLARWKHRDDMQLAVDALSLLQRRKFYRRRNGLYWRAELGPFTPDEWER